MDSSSTYQEQSVNRATEANSSKSDLVQKIKKSLYKQERDRLWKVIKQIRQSTAKKDFINNTVKVIQQELQADRVLIYRFTGETKGQIVAEALVSGWTPALDETISCNCFGGQKASDYQDQGVVAIENLDSAKLTPHQKQLLSGFQVQASLALPILLDSLSANSNGYELGEVWGLLVVQQCSEPRQWQEDEINLLYQLTMELTRVLQPPLPRLKSSSQQDFVSVINQEMGQSMRDMLQEIRHSLKADRALVYGFNPDGSGGILAESVDSQWGKASGSFDNDCFITAANCQPKYVVNDIYDQGFASCLIEQIEGLEAKAYIVIPIRSGDRLLGMLGVYQNSGSRNWQESEVQAMMEYASKLSFNLEQTTFIRHAKFQAKQLEQLSQPDVLTVLEKKAMPFMQRMINQIRQIMKADRVLVYGYNPDWSGEILAESIDSQWTKASNSFNNDFFLTGENYQAQYVVNDIYKQNFSPCLVAALEAIEAKAYIAVPITFGDRLLGILAVYQNSGSRNWQNSEVELILNYAAKFTSPMQQISVMRHSQFQTKQIEKFSQQDILTVVNQGAKQSMEQRLDQIRQFMQVDRALIYGFNPDGSGEILAESVDSQWNKASDSFDNDCFLTAANCEEKYVVNDIYSKDFAPCLIEQIEGLEAKAYMVVPIKSGDRLLGMLGVYQNSGTRNWQDSEVQMIVEYAPKFSHTLEQTSPIRELKFQAQQAKLVSNQDFLASINQNARQLMQNWLDKIRHAMNLDRAVIHSFNPDWSGEMLVESFAPNYSPAGNVLDQDFYFKGGEFEPYYLANDVHSKGLAGAVLEKFEAMQAQAYIVVPIQVNNQLLGLLGVYQNSGTRNWQESEIKHVVEYATRFAAPLQQTAYLRHTQFQSRQMAKAFEREKGLSKMLEKVRLAKEEQAVWQIATDEGRKILNVDRVAIYRFNPDWSGNFVAESAAPGWSDLTKIIPFIEDTFLQNTKGGRYKNGETFAVEDIYLQGHKQCHIELLEQMEARAYALAPIFIADSDMFGSKKLWGIIGCYQNTGARRWQDYEVDTLRQLGLQVGVAMQQINYLTQLEKQSELEKTNNKISEQIRRADNIDDVFKVTTQEVRQALNTDRTVVYQFNPDWSGQVVAESVASGWNSLLVEQTDDQVLSGNRTGSDRCILRKWSTEDIVENDTYLQKTQASKYFTGKKYTAVNDIYTKKFPDCYVKSLEKYQARAYIIAPIFQGDKLWGLLGVYQNSGSRNWEKMEAEQMVQLANQLGIAIQQIDYYEQLRVQSENLTQTLAREKAAREELQKQALDILKTVRPAFSGDLTVRAKVTETEIGTVAGAYNTTLDSLKDIVEQVQAAALQVTETTGSSSSAIKGLSLQSERQLMELQEAVDKVKSMIEASTVTTENAQKVEVAIEQANQTVQAGDQAMNNTVDSIASIRETVADAGKRVKRLSDSSQKISKVVSLISSFATQTNLLALNAALEATRAGEYGKGFAVVADEVRNLSLQSSEATTEIEKLVREIQEETKEVAAAMEAGVDQVAEGTNLVNETRESLNEIVIATAQIQGLVQGITSAANVQTQEAESVTQVMGQVAEIANETSQDSGKISVSFEQLEQLAQNLQASVSQFKVK